MNRIVTALAFALSLATLSASALAEPARAEQGRQEQRKDKAAKNDQKFPMKADEFRKLTAARVDKARGRLEKHISKKNLDADKARTVRAKFENGVARLNKKVDQVSEDGVVNKDEAKEVRDVARKMKEHRKGQGKQGKK